MPSYNAPGVYIQDVSKGVASITQASSTVGAMIGVTKSGVLNTPIKVNSWTEFIEQFADGLKTPFMEDSYLPYAVHGFFTNGGKELYVISIKNGGTKAIKTSETNHITAIAKSEGSWGNKVSVSLKKSASYIEESIETFDVTVSIKDGDETTSAIVRECLKEDIETKVIADSKVGNWLSTFILDTQTTSLQEEEFTLASGSDGNAITDENFNDALTILEGVDDVTFVALPGQTSNGLDESLIEFCNENGLFPMLDMPKGSSADTTRDYRRTLASKKAFTGCLAYPWGKVNDPLTNDLKEVPTCGHLMGVYARTITNMGVHKAPAGVDATVRGFVEMETVITPKQLDVLNPMGVICIMKRPNAGIVVWGARSLNSSDVTMRYVTDGLLNLNIKKSLYDGTQYAVFEPNDENLWVRLEGSCKAFLESLRLQGSLVGSEEEAYYVKVDETNNTVASQTEGILNIEIGYAPVKPAEFVVIKLAHSIETA